MSGEIGRTAVGVALGIVIAPILFFGVTCATCVTCAELSGGPPPKAHTRARPHFEMPRPQPTPHPLE